MIKVKITKDGQDGFVTYNEQDRSIDIDFPDDNIRKDVMTYLTTPRDYKIPRSNRIDDYRVVKQIPTESKMFFELAMSSLYGHTHVWVEWEKSWQTKN